MKVRRPECAVASGSTRASWGTGAQIVLGALDGGDVRQAEHLREFFLTLSAMCVVSLVPH